MKVDSILESSNNQETKVSLEVPLVLIYKYSLSYLLSGFDKSTSQ